MESEFRTGFVALLGKPNAGKSTLLNALMGTRLAAVSALPQTTRDRLSGIYSDEKCQVIFVDLPGLITPTDRLNECLREQVHDAVKDVDVILHLVDVQDGEPLPDEMRAGLQLCSGKPQILVVTKLDGKRSKVSPGAWAGECMSPEDRNRYRNMVGISAHTKAGLKELLDVVLPFLPPGEPLYDTEALTDRDMRYLSQEMIREKLFLNLHEELPYATAVVIEDFKEREGEKWYIAATIYVERDSQKSIVIGHNGATLKAISSSARRDIEKLCDAPVYLDLWVKVREKWRKNDFDLRDFGYNPPKKRRKR